MRLLAPLLSPVLVLLLSVTTGDNYRVGPGSTMQISGGSSMHDWSCDATVTGEMQTIASGEMTVPSAVSIQVAVDEIECGKGVMNKKLRSALESDKHPVIKFVLDEASQEAPGTLATTGKVTIAGVTKTVETTVTEVIAEGNAIKYSGSVNLLMTDFGVSPPTAMLGAMKTHDEVTVTFALSMIPAK